MFRKFLRFYLEQLWSNIRWLYIPSGLEVLTFLLANFVTLGDWIPQEVIKFAKNPNYTLSILLVFLLFVHIRIIYRMRKLLENYPRTPESVTEKTLNPRQVDFSRIIEEILEKHNIQPLSFADYYKRGCEQLSNGNISFAAAGYHGAFRQLEGIFLDRKTYTGDPDEQRFRSLKPLLGELEDFSNKAKSGEGELREIIISIEDTLLSLTSYMS